MGVYAYCIGQPRHPEPPPTDGLEGAPVRAERVDEFTVLLSDLQHPPTPSLASIRLHNAVVEAATAQETPLPFRFGQWFDSVDELRESLRDRRQPLDRQLRHVAGALEYGIRILDPGHVPGIADRSSGTAYLETLARRDRDHELDRQRGRHVAAKLRSWLGPLVRDERVRPVGGETLAAIAHLVSRHDTGNYERRVREFPPERPELRFHFTGPWPPYGFME